MFRLIRQEKLKSKPDVDYIRFLQQLTDRENVKAFLSEYKQTKHLEKLRKANVIELNDYFNDSGKREENGRITKKPIEYQDKKTITIINDMSKYKFNKN